MATRAGDADWPDLPLAAWADTCATLHLWTQIVGKVRMAHAPMVNHWWQVTLYVTSRGLATSPIPYGGRSFEIAFDFIEHAMIIQTSDGARETLALRPCSVADFYRELMGRLRALGIAAHIWTMPCEIVDAVPFDIDRQHAAYDPDSAQKFWRILLQADRLFKAFRADFLGKVSPVHFFWGSFDLAVTRFSGRRAPEMAKGAPNTAPWVMAEAYSHEVSSCGFWPGNSVFGKPAFFSYAYPEPQGFANASAGTPAAFHDKNLGQFLLPYDDVRNSDAPDTMVMDFLRATYRAAADLGGWDRAALERGRVG